MDWTPTIWTSCCMKLYVKFLKGRGYILKSPYNIAKGCIFLQGNFSCSCQAWVLYLCRSPYTKAWSAMNTQCGNVFSLSLTADMCILELLMTLKVFSKCNNSRVHSANIYWGFIMCQLLWLTSESQWRQMPDKASALENLHWKWA